MKLFVINLKHRKDRLDTIKKECEREGVEFERIDAIKEPGTSGPGKSHCKGIEYAIEKGMDEILITEDDILLNKNFIVNFEKCYKTLPEDWDIFLGGLSGVKECKKINEDLVKVGFFTGVHFILYRNKSFDKVLKWHETKRKKFGFRRLNRNSKGKNLHIDRYLGELSSKKELNIYCARNFLIETYNCFSDVRKMIIDDTIIFKEAKRRVLNSEYNLF